MTHRKLQNNVFLGKVMLRSQLVIERQKKKKIFQDRLFGKKPPPIFERRPKYQKFFFNTYWAVNEITHKLDALEHCVVFLNSYPKTALWSKNFYRSDYMRYHLEVYYANISGVFDRCLLLTNHIYGLGFKSKDAKYKLITENENLKGEKIIQALHLFQKSLQKVKSIRNYLEHQGTLSDKKLDDLRLPELMVHLKDSKLSKVDVAMLKKDLNWEYRQYIKEKKEEIESNNEAVNVLVGLVFDGLHDRYTTEMKRLTPKKASW